MASVRSRIAVFEAQAHSNNLPRKQSLIDLHDWVLDDMPPPQLQLQPSSPQKHKPKPKPKPPSLQGVKKNQTLMEARRKGNNHVTASSMSSFHSVSLSSDNGTDPGNIVRIPSVSSLTESFEEISIPLSMNNLAPPPPPPLPQRPTTVPPQQSYAAPNPLPYVPRRRASDRSSIQSLASPTSSLSQQSSSSLVQTPTLATTLPLPPPSSHLLPAPPTNGGLSTAAASVKNKRPTPVPVAARKRYISIFNANIIQRRRAEAQNLSPKKLSHAEAKAKAKRTRQAAGWRGLSVDLITATPEELLAHDQNVKGKQKEWDLELVVDENVGPSERLEGGIVRALWSRSRIEKSKLAEIWSECDPEGKGSLDADSFIRGMWRIDEHLRRAQAQTSALRNATSTSLTSPRSGIGSLKIKPGRPGVHRSTSRSSIGMSISSVNGDHRSHSGGSTNSYPPPPPLPNLVLR